jgi:NCAIR mutase (PurE)-related protein
MDPARLSELLENVRSGRLSIIKAMARLRQLPFEDLGFAKVDHHRGVRQGFPEVVLGEGKEPKQIAALAAEEPRDYRLKTTLLREGGGQLSLLANVQGETGTVHYNLVLQAYPE